MRTAVLAVLGVGVPLVTALRPRFLDACSVEGVLEYFTCRKHIPGVCLPELEEQAEAFCSSYLAVDPVTVTVVLSTEYPTVSVTTLAAVTVATTTTELITSTVEVTSLTTSTSYTEATVTSTTTSTTTRGYVPATPVVLKRAPTVSCASLVTKALLHHPASRLSKACSCLGIEPTTSTSTVTIEVSTAAATTVTVTATSTTTEIESETSVAVATSVGISVIETVITSTTTATATALATAYPMCDGDMWSGGIAADGETAFTDAPTQGTSPRECCRECQETPNCAGAFFYFGHCEFLVRTVGTGSVKDMCPLGVGTRQLVIEERYPEASVGVFKGPCHP